MKTSSKLALGISVAIISLILLNTVFDDSGDEAKQHKIYCQNVKIWDNSGHENGHPNYKEINCDY